jgi:hypothetical protein
LENRWLPEVEEAEAEAGGVAEVHPLN